jgi:hypothetical protein
VTTNEIATFAFPRKQLKQLSNYLITSKELKRDARKSRPVYLDQMLHVGTRGSTEGSASLEYATNEEISSPLGNSIASKPQSSATLQSLIGQYSDVFLDDMPDGLAPERSVELYISPVHDAKPVKRPIYKLSTAELKEVTTGPSIKLRLETITRFLGWMKFRTKSWFSLFLIS